jgi:radical SAM superfamily enzyme YgiQ (UPF0313 family)
MNILLVAPQFPDTFWSFRHALKFVSTKAGEPPLGLLTVAAMLPVDWTKKLVDLNVQSLKEKDLLWADYVFLSAMSIQEASAREVIKRCNALGRKVVAGGPLFTARPEEFTSVDHLVLNEAEITLSPFLEDLRAGHPRPMYTTSEWADVTTTPVPLWSLINPKHYATMNIQYSRGCPYDCEFCDITVLYGRVPRTKTSEQVVAELECLRQTGWHGHLFFVDDNFIGNRLKLKKEILPAITEWMDRNKHPFSLGTEASINLADDDELMQMMVRAGFDTVFVGIESPNEESLIECKKIPNKNRNLIDGVKKLQAFGFEVQGGFIVGFDNDPPSIFESLIRFIQESGIAVAMVGLLNAPRGTKLYKRLTSEGRLLSSFTGDNTDFSLNFIPKMKPEALMEGYRKIVGTIYSPKEYYTRVIHFLRTYHPLTRRSSHLEFKHIKALWKSMVMLGVFGKERLYYWKLFFWSLFRRPKLFPMAITFAIYGFHFRKVFEQTF